MQMSSALKSFKMQPKYWLYLFIFFHLIFWTLIPFSVRDNLPLDSIEGTIWGHQLEWGYDKNPFLNGWLTALATYLSGPSGWMIYLFSQLSVVFCFWAVWKLAKNMLPEAFALIAVVVLEGIQYYNFHAIDFNDNTLELSLWALSIYCFYQALRSPTYRVWMLTGLFASLGMMAKYYTAALITAMALLLLFNPTHRKQLKTLPPYAGVAVFLLVMIPHIIWLFFHDFITVTYVFERASSPPRWTNHFFFPAQFTWQQLQAFLPALVLIGLLCLGKKPRTTLPRVTLTRFDKEFLWFVGLGPLLLTVLLSLLLGIKLRAGWGMPLLSLFGVMALALIQPRLSAVKVRRFMLGMFAFMAILLGSYSFSLIDSSDPSSANFPGRYIANVIAKEWHDTYHTKLAYVGGSRWVGGNIGFYSTDHPAVFVEWEKRRAPWINLDDLQAKGAVFVWDITDHESMPESVRQQFPALKPSEVLTFTWRRNRENLPPIKIGIAILPPKG